MKLNGLLAVVAGAFTTKTQVYQAERWALWVLLGACLVLRGSANITINF